MPPEDLQTSSRLSAPPVTHVGSRPELAPPDPVLHAARRETATPVMAQFLDMKAAHPDCLLFFRMGDFYEMFFEDAAITAEALSITLTQRGQAGGEPIPMCGVPIHNSDRYLHELIRQGFRVAVAEQVEDPAEAKKRGSKAVVAREVVRLVTPGTITEDTLLDAGRANHLCAFADASGRSTAGGLAWTDMSTGALHTAPCTRAELSGWLARLSAAEIVLPGPCEGELREAAEMADTAVAELSRTSFDAKRGGQRAAAVFGAASLDAFGDFSPAEQGALGALVDYLELTQRGKLPLLSRPARETAGAAMRIDPATRVNLELTIGAGGGRAGSLLSTIDRTVTGAGARLIEAHLSAPLTVPAAVAARHEAVAWLLDEEATREQLRATLRGAPDLERALSRLGLGRGGPRDLASIGAALAAGAHIIGAIAAADARNPAPGPVAAAAEALTGHDALTGELGRALLDAAPLRLGDGDSIAPGFDAELDAARDLRDRSRQVIAGLQQTYQEQTGVGALKVKHNAVLGYFVETPATHARKMMAEPLDRTFIHRQTNANAVRFTTTELSDLEVRITRAAEQTSALERAVFEGLAANVLAQADPIRRAAEGLAALDVFASHATLAEAENWTRPAVENTGAFEIQAGRHPVVEAAIRVSGEAAFVANDCRLDAGPEAHSADPDAARAIWLVTGPNMAGKSTFLRQNALIAVLAQMGSFVPASAARIGIVDQLFSRVGASDDLARGRSTFMVEMVETAAILNQAGPRALVILDEIGRGTATYDGLSIAWATLEHLHETNRCRTLFATHYHELTALSGALPGLKTVTVGVREWKGDIVFLREIRPGAADRSYGVQVAKLAGLPPAVIERAKAVLERLETGEESPAQRARRMVDDLPLFAAVAEPAAAAASPALERLDRMDPDAMTPREALEALYELKRLAEEG